MRQSKVNICKLKGVSRLVSQEMFCVHILRDVKSVNTTER